jgi:imidazolonepropionase-like amidohydrolase
MQLYTQPHRLYCGLDLHARTLMPCRESRLLERRSCTKTLARGCCLLKQRGGNGSPVQRNLTLPTRNATLTIFKRTLRAICAIFAAVTLPAAGASLLLSNAHVIDPAVQQEYVGHVLIDGRRVVSVTKTRPTDYDGQEVDLTGKYLIPGLVDAHVHSEGNRAPIGEPDEDFGPEETARRMLYAGVTAYLDLGLDADTIFNARQNRREDALPGADIYAAGPVFIGIGRAGGRGGARVVLNEAEARTELDALASRRPDVIKLIFDWAGGRRTMSAEVMRALVAHARELGLKTVVHIGTWENARLAAEAAPTAITHLDDNAAIPPEVAQSMAGKRIFSIPTMAVQQDFLNILEDHRILDAPLLRGVASPSVTESYRRLDPVSYADCPTCQWQREGRKHYGVSLQRLVSAGVRIVAGSDTGNLGTFQGFSLHRELYLLNRWGLNKWDALAAGTTRAYELLGLNMGFHAGADATFLVLDASPLADIANTQSIDRILFRGQWVDREALRPARP